MADSVAVYSFIATATVATVVPIVVPFIAGRLERQRLRIKTQERRIDDARGVLDQASHALSKAIWQLHFTWRALAPPEGLPQGTFRSPIANGFDPDRGLTQAGVLRQVALQERDRLAICLGSDHPTVATYDSALDILGRLIGALGRVKADNKHAADWPEIQEELTAAWAARSRLADEASRLVGVRAHAR